MKIQCPCGAKYAFEVTPEMAQTPVQLVCQDCGVDLSDPLNELIRQELGVAGATDSASVGRAIAPPPPGAVRVPAIIAAPAPSPIASSPAVRVKMNAPATAPAREAAPAAPDPSQVCLKHSRLVFVDKCRVCGKPICPKCMELFGYVCSPHCQAKAVARGLDIPVYELQRDVVQAKRWRRIGTMAGAVAAVVVAAGGFWFWYAWFGCVPKATFAVRFEEAGYSGQVRLAPQNQIIFLHGGRLGRYDLKTKQEIWSVPLIDKKKIAAEASATVARINAAHARLENETGDEMITGLWRPPSVQDVAESMEQAAAAALRLHVRGENIWVQSPDRIARYNWQTGQSEKIMVLDDEFYQVYPRGEELLLIAEKRDGQDLARHLSLVSGEVRTEEIAGPAERALVARGKTGKPSGGGSAVNQAADAVVADKLARSTPKPIDPDAAAAKAQSLPIGARLALPAVLAAGANQQRAMAELAGQPKIPPAAGQNGLAESFASGSLIPDGQGFVQVSVKLVESRFAERVAMKAAPKKSAFDGPINQAATADIANEILNDMQRDRGMDKVVEDQSRYQVTLRRPGASDAADWTGEVIGSPELHPLKTVNVLSAGKSITVFDKHNKKLWESKLNYEVPERLGFEDEWQYGLGPCVEHGDALFVFDQGVLTAFDLTTGNVRWRLPSVGVAGLFFDDSGMIYVNTTSASPESIKYSRQIDISEKTSQMVLKVDPKTGKQLWGVRSQGMVGYVSGKFIYTTETYHADDDDKDSAFGVKTGLEVPSHVRIRRLAAGNGKVMWEHYQMRAPLDVQFDQNSIQLLFKKELQVLRFLAL